MNALALITATVEPTSTVPEHRVTSAGFRVLPGHHTSAGLHDFTVVPKSAPRDGACLGVLVWVRTSENKVHSASVRKIGLRAGSLAWHQQTDTDELGPREDLVAYIRSHLKEHR